MDVFNPQRWTISAVEGGAFLGAPLGVYYTLGLVSDISLLAGEMLFIPTHWLMLAVLTAAAITAGLGALAGWGLAALSTDILTRIQRN